MDVRFLGHACFTLSDGETTLLIDPFLTQNPKAAASADDVPATTFLLTHGHSDHFGDTVAIARRTGAAVVAITEIADELEEQGLDVRNCNLGGTASFDWGWVKLVPAWHFTMDRFDAVDAAGLVGAQTMIPCHYGTFPLIDTDARAFQSDVQAATGSRVVILEPGEAHTT